MKISAYFLFTLLSLPAVAQEDAPVFLWIRDGHSGFKAREVISQEKLQHDSFDLKQSLSHQPGLVVFSQGGHGQVQTLFLQGANSEHVLVLLDGMVLNDPTSPSGGFDFSNIDPAVIESVDVWKGPQGVRWGPKAFAGVIEIRTKKPNSQAGLSGKLVLNDQGAHTENLSAWGLLGSEFKVLLSASHQRAEGPSVAGREFGNTEKDASSKWTVFASTWWDTFDYSLQASLFSLQGNNEYDKFGGPGGDDPNAKASKRMQIPRIAYTRILSDHTRLETSMGWMNWRRFENDAMDSQSASFLQSESLADSPEVRTRWISKNNHRTLELGIDLSQERSRFRSVSDFGSEDVERKHSSGGIYILPEWEWSGALVSTGLRYHCEQSQGCFPLAELRAMTPEGVVASWAMGRRAPNSYQLYSSFGNEELKTESVSAFDLTKTVSFKNKELSISAFVRDYDELIDYDFTAATYLNVAQATVRGVEVAGKWILEDSVLTANLTYQEARDQKNREDLLRRPNMKGFASILTPSFGNNLFEAKVLWMGPRTDVDNLGDRVRLGDLFSLDLSQEYRWSAEWKSMFEVRNLLEQKTDEIWGYGRDGRVFYLSSSFLF